MSALVHPLMTGEPAVVLRLTMPPSTNRLWRPARGRDGFARTAAYRTWLTAAGWEVHVQRARAACPPRGQTLGGYAMRLRLPPGLDVDNGAKAVGDLLQAQGVVMSDGACEALLIERDPSRADGTALVELWALEPAPDLRLTPDPLLTRPRRGAARAARPDLLSPRRTSAAG